MSNCEWKSRKTLQGWLSMKRAAGFLVMVVSFIIIIFVSLDQPCMLDIFPDSIIVEGADNQEPVDQDEADSPENEDEPPSINPENPAPNETGSEIQKTGAGASKIHPILGEFNNLSEEEQKNIKKWRNDIVKFAADNPGLVFINGFTSEKMVCLTFDDGPDDVITPQVLNILKRNHVKASFFFVGNKLDQHPDVVQRAYREGHLVLSHSWSHQQLNLMEHQEIRREIQLTEDKLYELIGQRPAFIRPPFGQIDKKVTDVIKGKGGKIILWSIDTSDGSQGEKGSIVKNATEHIRPGDVILLHCDGDKTETVKALPEIITSLREKGYQFVDLGEMLQINPYQ